MKPTTWNGSIPVEFLYTAGVAGEAFLSAIRDTGILRGTRCRQCEVTYLPPRIYCEKCFSHLTEWVDVEPRGTVHSATVVHVDRKGAILAKPSIIALVTFPGVRGGLIHRVEGADPEAIVPGTRVDVMFRSSGDRTGSILDISGFRVRR